MPVCPSPPLPSLPIRAPRLFLGVACAAAFFYAGAPSGRVGWRAHAKHSTHTHRSSPLWFACLPPPSPPMLFFSSSSRRNNNAARVAAALAPPPAPSLQLALFAFGSKILTLPAPSPLARPTPLVPRSSLHCIIIPPPTQQRAPVGLPSLPFLAHLLSSAPCSYPQPCCPSWPPGCCCPSLCSLTCAPSSP